MRLAIFASGSGSNAEALMQAANERGAPYSVRLVITNRADAGVTDRAARFGIESRVLSTDEVIDGEALIRILRESEIDAVALAGYLRMIPAEVVDAYRHRILNIHPALLPAFGGHGMYGRNVHRAVIEAGVRWSGATVHFVDREYDTGPIILQQIIPVEPDDSPDSLAERVLEVEHIIYPAAIRLLAENRLAVDGRRVRILDHPKQDKAS